MLGSLCRRTATALSTMGFKRQTTASSTPTGTSPWSPYRWKRRLQSSDSDGSRSPPPISWERGWNGPLGRLCTTVAQAASSYLQRTGKASRYLSSFLASKDEPPHEYVSYQSSETGNPIVQYQAYTPETVVTPTTPQVDCSTRLWHGFIQMSAPVTTMDASSAEPSEEVHRGSRDTSSCDPLSDHGVEYPLSTATVSGLEIHAPQPQRRVPLITLGIPIEGTGTPEWESHTPSLVARSYTPSRFSSISPSRYSGSDDGYDSGALFSCISSLSGSSVASIDTDFCVSPILDHRGVQVMPPPVPPKLPLDEARELQESTSYNPSMRWSPQSEGFHRGAENQNSSHFQTRDTSSSAYTPAQLDALEREATQEFTSSTVPCKATIDLSTYGKQAFYLLEPSELSHIDWDSWNEDVGYGYGDY